MNYASYTWNVSESVFVDQILNANNSECYDSDTFTMSSSEDIKWSIRIYPNGTKQENQNMFKIYVRLLTFPSKWKNFHVCSTISFKQIHASSTKIGCFIKSGQIIGTHEFFISLSQLLELRMESKLPAITITAKMIILKTTQLDNSIEYDLQFKPFELPPINDKRELVPWNLNKQIVNFFKNTTQTGQRYETVEHFYKMFCFVLYPQGGVYKSKSDANDNNKMNINSNKTKNDIGLYLQLCGLPPFCDKIKVQYYFKCLETGTHKKAKAVLSYSDKEQFCGFPKFMNTKIFKRHQTLTITCDITIIEASLKGTKIAPLKWNKLSTLNESVYVFDVFSDNDNEEKDYNVLLDQHDDIKANAPVMLQSHVDMNANINNNNQNLTDDTRMARIEEKQSLCNVRLDSMLTNINETSKTMAEMQQKIISLQNELKSLKEKLMSGDSIDDHDDMAIDYNHHQALMSDAASEDMIIPFENDDDDDVGIAPPANAIVNVNDYDNVLIDEVDGLNMNEISNELRNWMKDVVQLPQYSDILVQNGFDKLDIMKAIGVNELNMIGIEDQTHRLKIMRCVRQLENINQSQENDKKRNRLLSEGEYTYQ